jgi:hypothetical protein
MARRLGQVRRRAHREVEGLTGIDDVEASNVIALADSIEALDQKHGIRQPVFRGLGLQDVARGQPAGF